MFYFCYSIIPTQNRGTKSKLLLLLQVYMSLNSALLLSIYHDPDERREELIEKHSWKLPSTVILCHNISAVLLSLHVLEAGVCALPCVSPLKPGCPEPPIEGVCWSHIHSLYSIFFYLFVFYLCVCGFWFNI